MDFRSICIGGRKLFRLDYGVYARSYLYFKYKIFEPYEKAVTKALDQSQDNLEEQGKIIKNQEAMIDEMNSLLKNREDIKGRLGDN